MMRSRFLRITALVLTAGLAPSAANAQAPVAGSGALPALDPFAQSPRDVVEAVEKMMSNRKDREPLHAIRGCFHESRLQPALLRVCRQRLAMFNRRIIEARSDIFAGLPPLEIYIRFVEIAGDPDSLSIRKDLFALRGIIGEVDEAGRFRTIKECFRDAGPQSAIHQICRQQLDAFQTEILRTRGIQLRDIRPEAIRRRLLAVATAEQIGFMTGDTTAFESLRNIRRAQHDKKVAAQTALVKAMPYYCSAKTGGRAATLTSQLAAPGVCICSYGRRYAASGAGMQSRPVRVAYSKCGPAGRFRVGDLNGGRLRHGDWITLRAVHNGYLSMNRDGIVYANRERPGKSEKFRLIKATNIPGVIQPGELIVLVSARGVFVVPDLKQGRLKATKQPPAPHEYFVLTPD
jgi:hypothetical protein